MSIPYLVNTIAILSVFVINDIHCIKVLYHHFGLLPRINGQAVILKLVVPDLIYHINQILVILYHSISGSSRP